MEIHNGKKIVLMIKGIYQQTDLLNISQVLNDEAIYDLDISGNLVIGEVFGSTIVEVFGSDISKKTNSKI